MSPLNRALIVKIVLVFAVFFLFFSNAVGLLQIGWVSEPNMFIQSNLNDMPTESRYRDLEVFSSPEFFALVIIGTVLVFSLPMLNVFWSSLLCLVCMIPPFLMNYYAPQGGFFSSSLQPLIPMEYTFLMILVLFITNNLLSLFVEMRHKRMMLESFSHFVPPQIAEQISKNPAQIDFGGESRNLTVMFTDLIDFTQISEKLNPKQLTALLNAYFTEMTEVLYQHDATIDKYMGDSIMAFWNAPMSQPDHANRAVAATLQMHQRIKRLTTDFQRRGWPAPNMSVGINTGLMNVGNMGSKYRIAYTVIGDAVNTASRIEQLTRFYHVPTVVSETTAEEATDFLFRELDHVAVKGKYHKIKIYQPMCKKGAADESMEKLLQNHEIAMAYYLGKNWVEAQKKFENLYHETDDEYYRIMLKIIEDEYQIFLR